MDFDELWHGVGSIEAWHRLRGGHRLEIVERHIHDPGDYGRALYFTDVQSRARAYAAQLNGRRLLARVTLGLRKPLVLDWRKGSAADPRHPANLMLELLEGRFGNPVRGVPEAREEASLRWRRELMVDGYDGIVAHHKDDTEVAVYDPATSIRSMELVEVPPA